MTARPPTPAAKTIVGIIGGSVSHGHGVAPGQRYGDVLSRMHNMHVVNRAVRASGCAMASFCIDQMFAADLDVLVIEFAPNDGAMARSSNVGLLSTGALAPPLQSMERLLRRLKRDRPGTLPILLYMCAPGLSPCEGLFGPVARHYGVSEISLADEPGSKEVTWQFAHPDAKGHSMAAKLIVRAVKAARDSLTSQPQGPLMKPLLPTAIWLNSSWESIDKPWHCASCDTKGCQHLPVEGTARGFECKDYTLTDHLHTPQGKFGWAGSSRGAVVAFKVRSRSKVLVALLCSYTNVGIAGIGLGLSSRGIEHRTARELDLRWESHSSQHCLAEAGESGKGAHTLWVDVRSSRADANQVKVFGVYTQATVRSLSRD